MKEIPLTQEQVALVDDEDFEWLNQWKWYAHRDRNTFYAARAGGRVNGSMTTITMHSVIIGKPPKGLVSDHRDCNGLNNQRTNLRFVTTRGMLKTDQGWLRHHDIWEFTGINKLKNGGQRFI